MRKHYLALVLASVLLAGSAYCAAGEDGMPPPPPVEEFGRGGPRRGGPGRHHGRGNRRDDRWDHGPRGDFDHRGPGPRHQGPGFGPGHMWGGPRGMGMGHQFLTSDLDLTADQKNRLLDVATANFRSRMEVMMDLADAKRTARDLRRDDDASPDAIVDVNRVLGELRGRLEAQDRQFRDQIRDILTSEQWERMERRPHRFNDDDDDAPRPGKRGPDGKRGPGPR